MHWGERQMHIPTPHPGPDKMVWSDTYCLQTCNTDMLMKSEEQLECESSKPVICLSNLLIQNLLSVTNYWGQICHN